MLTALSLEEGSKLVWCHLAITEYLGKEPRTDCLAGMNWDNGDTSILVPQEAVTSFDSDHIETCFAQRGNHLLASESGQFGHRARTTFCTPTKSNSSTSSP
jgi:hypothetical protein